jgi:hypothetical protein
MHGMNKMLAELFDMLKVAEKDIQKNTNNVLLVRHSTQFKKKKSGSNKKGKSKGTGPSHTPKKDRPGPKADAECFFCKEKGHLKRNSQSTWQKRRRMEPQAQVYLIYILLMFT